MALLRWLREVSDVLFVGIAPTFDDAWRRAQYIAKRDSE